MHLFCVIFSSYAGVKQLFCNCTAPASSSWLPNKCVCNTEHYALPELLLAQAICFSFAKARHGMKKHLWILPEISWIQLWKQTELIVFSCSGQGVPLQCTGLQGSRWIRSDLHRASSEKQFLKPFCGELTKNLQFTTKFPHHYVVACALLMQVWECQKRDLNLSTCVGKKTGFDF